MESGPDGCDLIVCGDRVDLEPEVGKRRVPTTDNDLKMVGIGEVRVASNVKRELGCEQRPNAGELLPVPALFEHRPGDIDRIHVARLTKLDSPFRHIPGYCETLLCGRLLAKAGSYLAIRSRTPRPRSQLIGSGQYPPSAVPPVTIATPLLVPMRLAPASMSS